MQEPASLEQTLRETEARLAWLEGERARQHAEVELALALRGRLINHRQRAQRRGVKMWEGAQRAALRMVLLALGCGALISGASVLGDTGSGVAIVVAFVVLAFEGLR